MINVSPSKNFLEKMKSSQGTSSSKPMFGRKRKKKQEAKKGFMKFAKPAAPEPDDDEDEM